MQEALFPELGEQDISTEVLLEKYAKGNEKNVTDVRQRVARALAAVEAPAQRDRWEQAFLQAQQAGFILGGRINSAAGPGGSSRWGRVRRRGRFRRREAGLNRRLRSFLVQIDPASPRGQIPGCAARRSAGERGQPVIACRNCMASAAEIC